MNETIKGLPVNELTVVAISACCGEYEGEDGQMHPEYELEVVNQEWYNKLGSPSAPRQTITCACCGHSLKISCLIAHKPTNQGYWVGRDCAAKIAHFEQWFGATIRSVSVALGERILCNKRENDFVQAHPEVKPLLDYARQPHANKITKDMLEKLRRYGDLSESQVALLLKIKTEDEQRRALATATAPTGRHTVRGQVLTLKVVEDPFSRYGGTKTKALVDIGGGVKVWGNLPSEVPDGVDKGTVIEFTGTFEPSEKDPLFGFWKRPSKFVKVAQDFASKV